MATHAKSVDNHAYPYLGMAHNDILRRQSAKLVEQYQQNVLGWNTALRAARMFAPEGSECVRGEGTGLDDSKQTEIRGTFHVCYWVQCEGVEAQWVVRFPLFGMMSEKTTLRQLRSEIATLQFLKQQTKVPVPAVIGYSTTPGTDPPPFMILENIDGIRMTLLLSINFHAHVMDRVYRDLAVIQLELLRHSSTVIGMLDLLPESSEAATTTLFPTLAPFSLDAMELERDGLRPSTNGTFTCASSYYGHKRSLWKHQLEELANSIFTRVDGRRMYLNDPFLRSYLDSKKHLADDTGPFYLFHADLHSSNVILDPKTFHVKAIIDWEGACFLPIASSLTPPKALTNDWLHELSPDSTKLEQFRQRLCRYTEIVQQVEAKLHSNRDLAAQMRSLWEDGSAFLVWALDDIRMVDDLIWQHIAPRLYPELKTQRDEVVDKSKEKKARARAMALDDLFAEFVVERLHDPQHNLEEVDRWVSEKLVRLKEYDSQLKADESST